MKIKVIKKAQDRMFTKDVLLLGLTGEVIEDYTSSVIAGLNVADINNHIIRKDTLVYFPTKDFCYWLVEGEDEYEFIED